MVARFYKTLDFIQEIARRAPVLCSDPIRTD
jgi:hypothetical protein